MGLKTWMASRGNVGGTARAVAKGWNTFKSQNPSMTPREIAQAYVQFRYNMTGESNLEAEAMQMIHSGRITDPLSLSWGIFLIENRDEPETVSEYEREWQQIMREELQKAGVEPHARHDEQTKPNMRRIEPEDRPTASHWNKRTLCSDGTCIGVIGPDGRCKECGKPWEAENDDVDFIEEENKLKKTATPETLLADWIDIASSHQVTVSEHEMPYLQHYLDLFLSSGLAGKYLHRDIYSTLPILLLVESFFWAGWDSYKQCEDEKAITSYEKARRLIPWPTVLYGLALHYEALKQMDKAMSFMEQARDGFESRADLLVDVIPQTVPDREEFVRKWVSSLDAQAEYFACHEEDDFMEFIDDEIARLSRLR